MIEIWVAVSGYENYYEVSSAGRVRSLDRYIDYGNGLIRLRRGVVLRDRDNSGYCSIALHKLGIRKQVLVHVLVAEHFLSVPGVREDFEVNHKDLCKNHNAASNLEWVTHSGNAQHALKHGRLRAATNPNRVAKLTVAKVCEMRQLRSIGYTYNLLAEMFGVSKQSARKAVLGLNWALLDDCTSATATDPSS